MRNIFRFTLTLAAALAFAGCAIDPNTGDDTTDRVSESLSALGAKLVGDLHYGTGDNIYETLSLSASGKYTASWKPCPEMAKCASHLESGTWSTSGTSTLKLHPSAMARMSCR
jgi:hypothetical protein